MRCRMKRLLLILIIIATSLFVLESCSKKRIKELRVYRINYTCDSLNKCDSTIKEIEHILYDKDSIIKIYENYTDGYYFVSEKDNKDSSVTKNYYNKDSVFLYRSISILNSKGMEIRTMFFDSAFHPTNTMQMTYIAESSLLHTMKNQLSDGTVYQYFYEYDQFNNIRKIIFYKAKDTIIQELHYPAYDSEGRITSDTVYYKEGRKIIAKKYLGDKLFYQTEKFEMKSDTGFMPLAENEAYWKKYYMYDINNNMTEERIMKMFPHTRSFQIASKTETSYTKDDQISQKTFYNSKNQKVYAIKREYEYQ